ncbi:hypothetical protein [Streptomyces sp. RerS4]|uniref:hypothetical protein n=1 Tax=Streptomyces sp. RerS4 TaxID=2942449 RepID=UPI00201C5C73|nr:hypothetical protein [Streptomyces sp. RerS4]UQX04543.1 hypothetical protein M4D82_31545 [Streptomyces sp. RerS4]
MYFSMKTRQPMTSEEEAVHEAASLAFRQACDERQALPPGPPIDPHSGAGNIHQHRADTIPQYVAADRKVHRASWASEATDLSHFHLRIGAMSYHVTAMRRLNMLMTDHERPPHPEQPHHLWWGPEHDALKAEDPEALAAAQAAYKEDVEVYRGRRPADVRGIAEHKLAFGGEYFVTPEEITAALAAYRLHSDDHVTAVLASVGKIEDGGEEEDLQIHPVGIGIGDWIKWIAFLERAERRGGFSVDGTDL